MLAAAALLALFAWGSASVLLQQQRALLTGQAAASISAMMVRDELLLLRTVFQAENEVRFFAATPPVPGIGRALLNNGLDPVDRNTLAQWRTRLEQIAQAYVAAHPEVFQLRLIGVADGGRELLRVVQDQAGKVTIAAQADLQRKGDSPYFQKALRLPEGRVHVSPIDLNVENERIEVPHRPTLRAAMPVRNAKGEVFAVVVVNVLAQPLLEQIGGGGGLPDVQEWVTDTAGHYLWHPQPGKAFAHLLNGPGATWQQEFTPAPGSETVALDIALPAGFSQATLRAPDGAHWLIFTKTLRAPEADGTGGVVLHSGIALQVLAARAWQGARGQVMLVWAMGLLVIGLLAFMLLRWRGTPLGLTVQTESATPGRTLQIFGVELPLTATGRQPLWQVVAAALLPVAWWALITVLLGQPVKFSFTLMLLPVLLASWWSGLYAGLAATVLAVVGAWDLGTDSQFMDWTSHGDEPGIVFSALTLLVTGLLVTFSQEAIRRHGALLLATQRAARENEQRLVAQAPVALAMFDPQMRYLASSARWKSSYGLAADADFTGRSHYEVFPEIPERWKAVHRRALAGETLTGQEDRFERADGSVQIVTWECKPWRTPDGAIGGLILWSEDVTQAVEERKAAEAALRESEAELKRRLAERTMLLDEVHHRVKNNLTVVASLLSLQQRQTQNAEVAEQLQVSYDRVAAIALVHEQLYGSQRFERIDFKAYLRQLCQSVIESSGARDRKIHFEVSGESFALSLTEAVPCSLLVNELLSNALKHAFPAGRTGRVWVDLSVDSDGARQVRVGDDGVGMAQGAKRDGSMGLKLVQRLTDQLGASLEREAATVGTLYCLRLPKAQSEAGHDA